MMILYQRERILVGDFVTRRPAMNHPLFLGADKKSRPEIRPARWLLLFFAC
jgi:hypothetical protein